AMRRGIIIAALRLITIDFLLNGPFLHGQQAVRGIDDYTSPRRSESAVAMLFQAEICATGVGHIVALEVLLAIGFARDVRQGGGGARRHGRGRKFCWRCRIRCCSRAGIPSARLASEGAVSLLHFGGASVLEEPVAIGSTMQRQVKRPRLGKYL